jgi:hypothetical protein
MGRRPSPELSPQEEGDIIPNLPTPSGTHALQGGEEVRYLRSMRQYATYAAGLIALMRRGARGEG